MLKVAITGNIASGKSTVEKFLIDKNYKVLDTDLVAHSLLLEGEVKIQIFEQFSGLDILENGEISRTKLAKFVFSDDNLKDKLEQILHPLIKDRVRQFFVENNNEKVIFVSVPLLFEAKYEDLFDKIILVYAEDMHRLARLMVRNKLSLEEAKKRLECQISQDEKIPLADYVIYNNKDIETLSAQIKENLNYLFKNSTFPESK